MKAGLAIRSCAFSQAIQTEASDTKYFSVSGKRRPRPASMASCRDPCRGDEEVDARQTKRLSVPLLLLGVNLDPGAEGRLKQVRLCG